MVRSGSSCRRWNRTVAEGAALGPEEAPPLGLAVGGAGAGSFRGRCAGSAWLVAARPTAVALIAVASRAPAMLRRRNPIPVARAVLVVVWWVWLVFAEVFMTLIVHPAMAPQ